MTERPAVAETDEALREAITTLTPFRTNPRSGRPAEGGNNGIYNDGTLAGYSQLRPIEFQPLPGEINGETGMIVDEWYWQLGFDLKEGIDYVVYSYDTPIAWHVESHYMMQSDGFTKHHIPARWVISDQSISAATSLHQFRVTMILQSAGAL